MDEPKSPDTELLVFEPKKRSITIEPALLLLFLSFSLSATISTNQIIYQACTVKFGFEHADCDLLGTHNASKDIETIVQPYAANILVAKQLIESIVPGVLSLFLGPWSDRFGRKPVIMSSLFGYFLAICMSTVIAWISVQQEINPWAYALTSIPIALTGGLCGLLTSSISYIADVSNPSNRALRLSLVQVAIFVGMLIGNLASSDLYRLTSTAVVFSVSSALTLLALLYVGFLVRESVQDQLAPRRMGALMKFASLFDLTLVSDVFSTCFRRRENSERPVILLTMLSLMAGIFVMNGSETVFYMFAREKFQWTIGEYNMYDSTGIVTQIVGNIVGLKVLVKYFGISEVPMAMIAYGSAAADYLAKAMATMSWHLYAGLGVAFLKFIASPMCRSILAANVAPNEIGKIYALTSAIESMSALVASPLYSFVYQSTLSFYPGAFNMISAGVYGACICAMTLVMIVKKTHPRLATGISYGPITSE